GGPVDGRLPPEEQGTVVERRSDIGRDALQIRREVGELGRVAAVRAEHEAAHAEVSGLLGRGGEAAPEGGPSRAVPERAVRRGVAQGVQRAGALVTPAMTRGAGQGVLPGAHRGVAEETLAAALGAGEGELPARRALLRFRLLRAAGHEDRELEPGGC